MYENPIITCRIDSVAPPQRGGGGGRGGTPLYKPYRYVPPQRVGFLCPFGLKTGIDFAHFGLESGMVFEETPCERVNVWTYLSFQFQMNQKKSNMRIWKGFFEI